MQAGDWASSVPDRLSAQGRFGVVLDEDVASARLALEQAVAAAADRGPLAARPPAAGDLGGRPVRLGAPARRRPAHRGHRGGRARRPRRRCPCPAAGPYGSDLRLLLGLGGIPTLQYGPGSAEDAHAPREKVSLGETLDVARTLLVLALRRCGVR